jgi:hypothetical protein
MLGWIPARGQDRGFARVLILLFMANEEELAFLNAHLAEPIPSPSPQVQGKKLLY